MADSTTSDSAPKPAPYKGRLRIFSDYERITRENVVKALADALPGFARNKAQISYLWNYYKGDQPILMRKKDVRPDINNAVVENHAQEIVAFKIGYQLAEPLQYTCRMQGDDAEDGQAESLYERTLNHVNELNTFMFAEDKASCDRDLFEWMCVCGIGFRMCEASPDVDDGGAPFAIYTLDPRNTFVVESSAYHHRPVMSVWIGLDPDTKQEVFNVYTDEEYFRIVAGEIVETRPHTYGTNPIVEYRLNNARMGVFEPVLSLLDAINNVESNRLDDIEQTVQALMKFINCDIERDDFVEMLKLGAVKVKTSVDGQPADIDVIKTDLDQSGTQVTKDDLYQSVVNICGMPNRNGTKGSSSDTGAAVLLRDGWTLAESHAKSYELQFKRSERRFLRVVLSICEQSSDTDLELRIRDIELAFNRRNYENILVKAQVLTTMLQTGKIHPQLAFQACGLFTDPDAAYKQSCEYLEQKKATVEESALAVATQQAIDEGNGKLGPQPTVPEPDDGNNAA